MFLLTVIVISLGVAFLRGGDLLALGRINIRYSGVLILSLFLKAAVYSTLGVKLLGTGTVNRIVLVAVTMALLAVLWINRDQPGFWILGLGLFANFVVILANNGAMPISVAGVQRLGLPTDPVLFHQQYGAGNMLASEGARLAFLGDVLVTPSPLPAKVLSIGDVLVALGAFVFFQKVMVGARAAGPEPTPEGQRP